MRRLDELHLDYPFRRQPDVARSLEAVSRSLSPCGDADEAHGNLRRSIAGRTPASHRRVTRFIPISCAGKRSSAPIMCGRWTSPTFRWRVASSISPPSSTCSAGGSCRIACRSRWRRSSASRRYAKLWRSTASRRYSTRTRSQFTSIDFTGVLLEHGVAISMDGKGAWRDNVFVERLWRSVKYEEVYLRAYDSVSEARASIARYLAFHNDEGRIRALTGARRTRLTSGRRQSRRRHKPSRRF